MIPFLLLLVLLAAIAVVALRRQFQHRPWKQIHLPVAGLVLASSGFLVILSLFMVFDSVENLQSSQVNEMNIFYASLLVLVISVASFAWLLLQSRQS